LFWRIIIEEVAKTSEVSFFSTTFGATTMAKFGFFSMSELLASPRLRPIVERLHPAAVIATVKGVYEDVVGEMYSAATERRNPELAELTDKILARLQDVERKENTLLIDASGVLFASPGSEPLLSRAAIDEMIWCLDVSLAGLGPEEEERPVDSDRWIRSVFPSASKTASEFCSITNAEDVLFFGTTEQAELALIQTYCARKILGIARRDLFEDAEGNRFADRIFLPKERLHEVGASNKVRLDDFLELCSQDTGLIWLASGVHSDMAPTLTAGDLTTLRNHARLYNIPVIGRYDFAPLLDLSNQITGSILPLVKLNLLDYDLILTGGGQLLGGPNCGILMGRKAYLEPIRRAGFDRLFAAHRADLAGLVETLRISRSRDRAEMEIPVLKMMAAPKANLINRAERLAPQLRATAAVRSAEVVECETSLYPGGTRGKMPSVGILIHPAKNSASELDSFLRKGRPGLKGRVKDDTIIIDLKTVPPRWDQVILSVFEKMY
jgi:L-seryl-tRNA(Ser) seleniumtransferase